MHRLMIHLHCKSDSTLFARTRQVHYKHINVPIRIKLLWLWPPLRIVVKVIDGYFNAGSSGNGVVSQLGVHGHKTSSSARGEWGRRGEGCAETQEPALQQFLSVWPTINARSHPPRKWRVHPQCFLHYHVQVFQVRKDIIQRGILEQQDWFQTQLPFWLTIQSAHIRWQCKCLLYNAIVSLPRGIKGSHTPLGREISHLCYTLGNSDLRLCLHSGRWLDSYREYCNMIGQTA